MNTSITTIVKLLCGFVFSFVMLSACQQENPPKEARDLIAEKNYPNDHFYLQRAYPDAFMDINAYEKGLKQARQMAEVETVGFDGEWTIQGPGNIGARANTVAVHPQNENIIYTGFSSGGVWKTTDGGTNWVPLFDDQLWPSIGDIVIDQNNPETVYVATGDPNISFYPMLGDGVYKSTNGGATWTNIGLQEQRVISKIIIHPTNPNIIYAASMGLPFIRNNERGLYKTSNGGATWQQVLFISDQAGVTDVVMDPFDPNTLYASGWDRIRTNMESVVSGPGAKFFKTTDGGANWIPMQNGIPQDDAGRTGLAISTTTPGLVYAMTVGTNSQLSGIYKTTDAGTSWSSVAINGLGSALGGFGWYFGKIRISPANNDEIYILGVGLWRHNPASGTWQTVAGNSVHADKHDLTFTASGAMYLATDGGLYKSMNNAASWTDIENIPTTQFYRVAYNPHLPDLYYGGAQDNGTTGGNAADINNWPRIYGGDGFQPVFHPTDPETFYVETQNGNIAVTTDGGGSWFSGDQGIESGDRRNWDMPYIMSPHNPDVLYAGTYRMYKSETGNNPLFNAISEDLTDGLILNPRHHNITTISESPIQQGLLYTGTADGNVWRQDNDGGPWVNISGGLPDRYVTEVKASPANMDWVYVTHSGYRDNEFIPRIHRSNDKGATWEIISANLPDVAINDVYILPNHADSVLFVATDAGVYGTLNGGQEWKRLGVNMPFVPSFDLDWNVAHNTLMAGTFARSIMTYPIDSLLATPPDTTTATKQVVLAKKPLRFSPNPASSLVTIEFEVVPGKASDITVFDLKGSMVKQLRVSFNKNGKQVMDVANLPAGIYLLKVSTENLVKSGKFVKK